MCLFSEFRIGIDKKNVVERKNVHLVPKHLRGRYHPIKRAGFVLPTSCIELQYG